MFDFDPIATKIKEKEIYEEKKRVRLHLLKKQEPRFPEGIVSSDFKEYLTIKFEDPDPTSSRVNYLFDWRHHGGNLCLQKLEQDFYLVQNSLSTFDKFPLRLIRSDGFSSVVGRWNEDNLRKELVYEIIKLNNTYALRKKNSVHVVNILDQKETTKFTSKHEIASCILCDGDLYSIDLNGKLERHNIITEITLPCDKLEISGYPVTMKNYKADIFSINDAERIFLYDNRNNEISHEFFNKSNLAMECEEIFIHEKSSKDKNLVYIATSHLLYLCDTRNRGIPLMQINHQLFRPPMMMKVSILEDNYEIICISSNSPSDIKLFCYSHNEGIVDLLPLAPISLEKPLNEIRLRGKLLLTDDLTTRIRMSISGIELITNQDEGTLELFVQTSIGDILKTKIFTKTVSSEKTHDFEKEFRKWDNALKLKYTNTDELNLQFTQVSDLTGLKRVLLHLKADEKSDQNISNSENNSSFPKMHEKKIPKWKISMREAKCFNDVLAQHILAPWDIEEEGDEEEHVVFNLEDKGQKEMKASEKVTNWLTSHYEETIVKEGSLDIDDVEIMLENFEAMDDSAVNLNDTFESAGIRIEKRDTQTNTEKKKKRIKGF